MDIYHKKTYQREENREVDREDLKYFPKYIIYIFVISNKNIITVI